MARSVIDLSSSPEPSMSLARRKAKPKPKPRSRTSPFPIIELTDSDSDTDDAPTFSPQKKKIPNNPVAGTSSHPSGIAALQPKIGLSGSFENIPNTANRMLKASIARAFPLLELSDEENKPPESPFVAVLPIVERFSPFETVEMEDVQPANPPAAVVETVDHVPEADPISAYVARVLEIVPDVEPDYLLDLVTQSIPTQGDQAVEHVLHSLFEHPTYPKVDRKGKRKQGDGNTEGDEMPSKKTKLDYRNKERLYNGGVHYADMALEQLQTDFPYIPKAYIRMSLANFNRLYAPTYFSLQDQARQHQQLEQQNQVVIYPYTRRAIPFRPSRKGKGRAIHDAEFEQERAWLLEELTKDDLAVAENANEEYEDCGDGIECGCCFSAYPFDKMVQCPEAHLFCTACMTSYASTLLGSHDTNIKCMHQSGCTVPIPRSELQRFLPKKLMDLWERLTQRKEVHAAGLDGWEECPFCEWGCVIENPDEKLFRCENLDGCGVVSCRGCKKVDHLPKSCKEMEEDKNLDGRHAIEEAMTRALMRNCPKCQKAFIKEYGCNKMTCPECGTQSCYVCKQAITGYDHFNQTPQGAPVYQGSSQNPTEKCVLHDGVEQRHTAEVKEAAERAFEKYKQEHPDVDEAAIKVAFPPAPVVPQAVPNVQYAIGQLPPFMGVNPFNNVAPMAQLQLGGNDGFPIPRQPWMYNRLEEIAQEHARINAAQVRLRLERDAARIAEHARQQQQQLAALAQEEANQVLNAYHIRHQPQTAVPRVGHRQPEPVMGRIPARNQPPPAPPTIRRNPRRR